MWHKGLHCLLVDNSHFWEFLFFVNTSSAVDFPILAFSWVVFICFGVFFSKKINYYLCTLYDSFPHLPLFGLNNVFPFGGPFMFLCFASFFPRRWDEVLLHPPAPLVLLKTSASSTDMVFVAFTHGIAKEKPIHEMWNTDSFIPITTMDHGSNTIVYSFLLYSYRIVKWFYAIIYCLLVF